MQRLKHARHPAVQLGLEALKKAQRSSDSFRRFIGEALRLVPDLAEPVAAMAAAQRFVTPVQANTLCDTGSCGDDLQ